MVTKNLPQLKACKMKCIAVVSGMDGTSDHEGLLVWFTAFKIFGPAVIYDTQMSKVCAQ
jgi:hypothetical protein